MKYKLLESDVEKFLRRGWFYSNNAEKIINIIMEPNDRNEDITIKGDNPGDWKYCIVIA